MLRKTKFRTCNHPTTISPWYCASWQ